MTLKNLSDAIKAAARDILERGLVFNGTTSNVELSEEKFPEASSGGARTVREWFEMNRGAIGLSQVNGNAIFLNFDRFEGGAFAGNYGFGTIFHEILHKGGAIGGGYPGVDHAQIGKALGFRGDPEGPLSSRSPISQRIGELCF